MKKFVTLTLALTAFSLSTIAEVKEIPHNARSTLTGEFQPPAACKFLDLPPASLRNLQFAFD